jgi:thiol-disulfide isomerase/thioredoxin
MKANFLSAAGTMTLVFSCLLAPLGACSQDAPKPAPPAADRQQPADPQSKAEPAPSPTPEPTPEPPKKGAPAPDFTLGDLQGHAVRLSSLKGKAVLLNFWATWCDPCKIEMPWLVELQKKYGPQGLRIVGVALDDASDKELADFARKMGVNYTILKGTEKVGDLYGGIDRLPLTYYIDRSGNIVDVIEGLASESVIEDDIKRALGKTNSTTATGAK